MSLPITTDKQRFPSLHPYAGPFIDELAQLLTEGGGQYVRYVSPDAGDAIATGAPSDPYNATSAGVSNPIQQALDSFGVPATAAEEDAFKIVVIPSGLYVGSLSITHRRVMFYCRGSAAIVTPGDTSRIVSAAVAGGVKPAELIITGDSGVADYPNAGINFTIGGDLVIGDGGAGIPQNLVTIGAMVSGTVAADGGGLTGGVAWAASQCRFSGAFTIPTLCDFNQLQHTTFGGNLSVGTISRAYFCAFDGTVTVSSAPGAGYGPQGFLSCDLDAAGTFTGPAGSALFDAKTQSTYDATGITFAGGAGIADFIETRVEPVGIFGDCVANAVTDLINTNVQAGEVTRVTVTTGDPPVSALGTVLLMIVINGVQNALAAPFDLETLGAGVKQVLTLTAVAADLLTTEGGAISAEITSNNADMTNGTGMRVTVDNQRDGRIVTT